MNVTLSLDEQLVKDARKFAEVTGKSLNQLIREHLEQVTGRRRVAADIEEFIRLSRESKGNSRGWKFNREEIHDRKW